MILNLDSILSIQLDILLIPDFEKDKDQNSPNPFHLSWCFSWLGENQLLIGFDWIMSQDTKTN
jgi:FAD synthase